MDSCRGGLMKSCGACSLDGCLNMLLLRSLGISLGLGHHGLLEKGAPCCVAPSWPWWCSSSAPFCFDRNELGHVLSLVEVELGVVVEDC